MSIIPVKWAQRKIPVDLHFFTPENLECLRHKASGAALGLSCAACFEQPAGVFAGCGAVSQSVYLCCGAGVRQLIPVAVPSTALVKFICTPACPLRYVEWGLPFPMRSN